MPNLKLTLVAPAVQFLFLYAFVESDDLHSDIVIGHCNLFLVFLNMLAEQSHFAAIRSSIRLKTAFNLYK